MNQLSLRFSLANLTFSRALLTGVVLLAFFSLFVASSPAETATPMTHTLTASVSGQGSISPVGSISAAEGTSRSFVFNSDAGHRLVDVIVDGISIGPIDAFSFENISASHAIEAVFDDGAAPLTVASETDY